MKNLRSKGETLRFRSRVTNITFKLDRPLEPLTDPPGGCQRTDISLPIVQIIPPEFQSKRHEAPYSCTTGSPIPCSPIHCSPIVRQPLYLIKHIIPQRSVRGFPTRRCIMSSNVWTAEAMLQVSLKYQTSLDHVLQIKGFNSQNMD